MRGDCYIIGRPANIKSDFYYPYKDKKDQGQAPEVDENYRYEMDPEFCCISAQFDGDEATR